MTKAEKLKLCCGCDQNFYNGNNGMGIEVCWSLKRAKVVKRWRIGWWTAPVSTESFSKVRTLDCHSATGRYLDSKELPEHLHVRG